MTALRQLRAAFPGGILDVTALDRETSATVDDYAACVAPTVPLTGAETTRADVAPTLSLPSATHPRSPCAEGCGRLVTGAGGRAHVDCDYPHLGTFATGVL